MQIMENINYQELFILLHLNLSKSLNNLFIHFKIKMKKQQQNLIWEMSSQSKNILFLTMFMVIVKYLSFLLLILQDRMENMKKKEVFIILINTIQMTTCKLLNQLEKFYNTMTVIIKYLFMGLELKFFLLMKLQVIVSHSMEIYSIQRQMVFKKYLQFMKKQFRICSSMDRLSSVR